MKPYIVVGNICYNESFFVKHWLMSFYDMVNEIVIVDSFSTDNTLEIIKTLDINKKIIIIQKKWENNYAKQRNYYLDYIKKNIWPKHKVNLYYLRTDCDEIMYSSWLEKAKQEIEESPEVEAWRSNFYTFTYDLNHLDTVNPTETRVSLFKFSPDIEYRNPLHEMPVHKNTGIPLYSSPMDDSRLGIKYISSPFAYCHYTWCGRMDREFNKAVNYEKHYVAQGKSTQDKLNAMKPSKDSWWFDKASNVKFKGKLPEVFNKYGLLEGQENPENQNETPKISVYTIIKNSIKYDYPIIEAIRSVLPIADEIIVNCGDSEDGTTGLIYKAFDGFEKVKIFERKWEGRDQGTLFLRNQSNWAKVQCTNEICLYLQADEIYSGEDHNKILDAAKTLYERKDLIGAIFKWRHLDGDFGTINPDSYSQEIRLIRKDVCESIGDAQSMGFKLANLTNAMAFNDLLLDTDVKVFHIGWVREPKKMLEKLVNFDSYYHTDKELEEMHKDDSKRHINGEYNYGTRDKHLKLEENLPYVLYSRVKRFEQKYNNIIKNYGNFNISN